MTGLADPVPFRGERHTGRWLATLVALAVLVATVLLFVRPASDAPGAVVADGPLDAVLVLGGGDLERITAGVGLARDAAAGAPDGHTTTLLLSVPFGAPYVTCGPDAAGPGIEVACVTPDPFTTSGEGRSLLEAVDAAGWDRVAVTTSTYHLTRTRVLVERCRDLRPDLDVAYVDAGADLASLRGLWLVAQEWLSLLATPFDARCEQP